MEITKKVLLETNHTVWAYIYRDGSRIAWQSFSYIFTGCFFRWREHKALRKAYEDANKWADSMVAEEVRAEHGDM